LENITRKYNYLYNIPASKPSELISNIRKKQEEILKMLMKKKKGS